MKRPLVPVKFEPSGSLAWVEPGTTVLEAARSAGVTIMAPCGGRGVCGACGVRVLEGELQEPDEWEVSGLRRAASDVRLACRARVSEPVTVRPLVKSGATDIGRTVSGGELVAAVDLGTTNVVAAVVDRTTGREIGRSLVPNRQASWGGDVLARVSAALAGDARQLMAAAEASVVDAIAGCGVQPSDIKACVIAGNTAMSALIAGVPLESLASHPFRVPDIPVELPGDSALSATLAGADSIRLVPPMAGFVGGDALAAIIATRAADEGEPVLLVDVGTNAEIVLLTDGVAYVASAAAGPAFDGIGLSNGGPAVDGAIVDVRIEGDRLLATVLGDEVPRWFGGSGMVAVLSALARSGHVSADGLLNAEGPLNERFVRDRRGVLAVCPFDDAPGVCLSQLDVRAIQLAKAAIRVGIDTVLRVAGVRHRSVSKVYMAGAFGQALDPDDLGAIGLLPGALVDKVTAVGNASLQGAMAMVLKPSVMDHAEEILRHVKHVELATGEDFAPDLLAALSLGQTG